MIIEPAAIPPVPVGWCVPYYRGKDEIPSYLSSVLLLISQQEEGGKMKYDFDSNCVLTHIRLTTYDRSSVRGGTLDEFDEIWIAFRPVFIGDKKG